LCSSARYTPCYTGIAGVEQKTLENSVAYLKTWIARPKSDSRLAVSAASQAQKAADFIQGKVARQEGEWQGIRLYCAIDHELMTERMAEMQKIINAENGDLFDVLVHVVYASPRTDTTSFNLQLLLSV
jgi:hypothetical protein